MIARLSVVLPVSFALSPGAVLAPIERTIGEYRVAIHAPQQLGPIDPDAAGLIDRNQLIKPATSPSPSSEILLNGTPAILATLLVIEIHKDDFDRRVDRASRRPCWS